MGMEDSRGFAPEIVAVCPFCVEALVASEIEVRLLAPVRKRLPCKVLVLYASQVLHEADVAEGQKTVRIRLGGCPEGVLNVVVIAGKKVLSQGAAIAAADKERIKVDSSMFIQSQLQISSICSLPVLPRACAKEMMLALDTVVLRAKRSTLPKDDQNSDYLLTKGHEFTEVQDRVIREMLHRTMFRPFASDLEFLLSTSSNELSPNTPNPAFKTDEMKTLLTNMILKLRDLGAWNTLSYLLKTCHYRGADLGDDWKLTPSALRLKCPDQNQSNMINIELDDVKGHLNTRETVSSPTAHNKFHSPKSLSGQDVSYGKKQRAPRLAGLPLQGFMSKSTTMEVRTMYKTSPPMGALTDLKKASTGMYPISHVKVGASSAVLPYAFPSKLATAILSTENTSLSMSVASLLMACGLNMPSEDWNPGVSLMLGSGVFCVLPFCWKKGQFRLRSILVWISRVTVVLLLSFHTMGWHHFPCSSTCASGVVCQGGVLQSLFWLFTSASCHKQRVMRQIGLLVVGGLASLYLAADNPGCNGLLVLGVVLAGEMISLLTSLSDRKTGKKISGKRIVMHL